MRIAGFLFALLLPVSAFAAEQSLPPMSQNATTPSGSGYVFERSDNPEGGGRWTRTAPHPALLQQQQQQQYADPAEVTQAPPAAENADPPEVSSAPGAATPGDAPGTAPMWSNSQQSPQAPAARDPNPPVVSNGGGTWSLPQSEIDAMAGRAPSQPSQVQQPMQASGGMQSYSVTPIEQCLSQLPPAEAAEVRTRYVKPYEECQNRVNANARQQKTIEVTKQTEALTPETPRNYIRVAAPPEATPAKDNGTSNSGDSSGNSFIDISGNSKPKLNP